MTINSYLYQWKYTHNGLMSGRKVQESPSWFGPVDKPHGKLAETHRLSTRIFVFLWFLLHLSL